MVHKIKRTRCAAETQLFLELRSERAFPPKGSDKGNSVCFMNNNLISILRIFIAISFMGLLLLTLPEPAKEYQCGISKKVVVGNVKKCAHPPDCLVKQPC